MIHVIDISYTLQPFNRVFLFHLPAKINTINKVGLIVKNPSKLMTKIEGYRINDGIDYSLILNNSDYVIVNKPIEILGQNDFDNYNQKKFSAFSYAHSMVEVNTKLRANGINKLVIRESDYISQLPIPARNSIRIPLFILIDYADD